MICFDKILELDPENNDAKLKKGQIYTELKEYSNALAILDELIENKTDRKDEAIIAKWKMKKPTKKPLNFAKK